MSENEEQKRRLEEERRRRQEEARRKQEEELRRIREEQRNQEKINEELRKGRPTGERPDKDD